MNEVIVFGKGYHLEPGIKVFIKSGIRFPAKITVIAIDLKPEVTDFLIQQGCNIVDGRDIAKRYKVDLNLSPYTLKVILFRLYCLHYSSATNVYLCDFTDVYHQRDIFELIKNNKPYVSCEGSLVKDCRTNTTWIKICYNEDIYRLLQNKIIINGGSILGERGGCVDLLTEMCLDMGGIIGRVGNYQNIDQASLTKTIHFDVYRYNILSQLEICNLAHFSNAEIGVREKLITVNDNLPYVMHQYDVIKPLERQLYDKFAR